MKVALVTNWGERCGVAEYAQNLIDHCEGCQQITFSKVGLPLHFENIWAKTEDADVVHFNYASGIFAAMPLEGWQKFRQRGQKVLLTFHDSSWDMTGKIADAGLFDRIIVHEKAPKWKPYPPNVHVIQQPIEMIYVPRREAEYRLATAGMPFPWKGFIRTAQVARRLELGYLALLSESLQVNAMEVKKEILDHYPQADVRVSWFDYNYMVSALAHSLINVFDYDYTATLYGISAAVRIALAAGRPVVVSDCRMFRDLKDYPDEVYFVEEGLETTIRRVVGDIAAGKARVPKQILIDANWTACAIKYQYVYEELTAA